MATQILPTMPKLRIFRRLDVDRLSPEFIEKIGQDEGSVEYVDHDRPRDLGFTEEILEATVGAALVDSEGQILAEYNGPDAWRKVEKAKAGARITFDIDLDDDDPDLGL